MLFLFILPPNYCYNLLSTLLLSILAITSELIIKPMKDGSFQYLSNKVIKSDQNANAGWYMPRLTEEEWKANYSNN